MAFAHIRRCTRNICYIIKTRIIFFFGKCPLICDQINFTFLAAIIIIVIIESNIIHKCAYFMFICKYSKTSGRRRPLVWYLLMRLIAKYFSYLISMSVIVSSLLYRIRIWYVVQTRVNSNSNNKTKQSLVEFPICSRNYYRIDDMSARMLWFNQFTVNIGNWYIFADRFLKLICAFNQMKLEMISWVGVPFVHVEKNETTKLNCNGPHFPRRFTSISNKQ